MSRRHYLITYDISEDKRRTRVFNTLRDNGDHAQYSVFFCQLTESERIGLEALVRSIINQTEDQVLIVDLGKAEHDLNLRVEAVGQCYNPPQRCMIV